MDYDSFGRVRNKNVLEAGTNNQYGYQYFYDGNQHFYDEAGHGAALGRLTQVVHPAGSESLTYDALGRATRTTRCVDSTCKTLNQSFDVMGRLDTVTYPAEDDGNGRDVVRYGYNSIGRLKELTLTSSAGGMAQSLVTDMDWSADGKLRQLVYGNGTVTDFAYDPNRRWLLSASVKDAASTTLYQADYSYYNNGLVQTMSVAPSSANGTAPPNVDFGYDNVTYSYDGLKRLTAVSGKQKQVYRYDAIGNRTYALEDSHSDNPYLVDPLTARYEYDKNGNLRTEINPADTAKPFRTFDWDAENRLRSVVKQAPNQPMIVANYLYDQDGMRVKKSVGPVGVTPSTTLYFGAQVEVVNGELVKYYSAGSILVAKRTGKNGGLSYYHADRLGSTKLITDPSGGTANGNSYSYAAFGRTVAKGGAQANERGFTGQREDSEVGLIYMGARYYDPLTGRFISPDTIVPDPENPQSLNRYAYCMNNPVSYVDPSGHAPVAVAVFSAYMTATAAIAADTMWLAYVAWAGAGLTAVGYFTNAPELAAVGSVMLGFTGGWSIPTGAGTGALMELSGGLLGASVSLAISPLSPLDPGLKQAIGWAYMAYGVFRSVEESFNRSIFREKIISAGKSNAALKTDSMPPVEERQKIINAISKDLGVQSGKYDPKNPFFVSHPKAFGFMDPNVDGGAIFYSDRLFLSEDLPAYGILHETKHLQDFKDGLYVFEIDKITGENMLVNIDTIESRAYSYSIEKGKSLGLNESTRLDQANILSTRGWR